MAPERDLSVPLILAPIPASRSSEEQSAPSSPTYEGLHQQLHGFPFEPSPSKAKVYIFQILRILSLLTVGCLALFGLFHLVLSVHEALPVKSKHVCFCGDSVADAINLGCKYDFLASVWLPPHCIDEELSAEFEKAGPGKNGAWTYYADSFGTKQLAVQDVPSYADRPGGLYYATKEWHLVHCFFYWRKQIRSSSTGVTVEPRYNNEGHAIHCGKMLYQNATMQDVATLMGAALDSDVVLKEG
ncbi:hypothetical protein FDECE_11425 [Fusarium decemcellulare]|nr:hypothetical protein FDECE_11425 [Fusarium decemcellulare]